MDRMNGIDRIGKAIPSILFILSIFIGRYLYVIAG